MYVLLHWLESKDITIMKEPGDIGKNDIGDVVSVCYDDKFYRAKIIHRSEDKKFLQKIQVDEEGNIITPVRRIKAKPAVVRKTQAEKEAEKIKLKMRTKTRKIVDRQILELNRLAADGKLACSEQMDKNQTNERQKIGQNTTFFQKDILEGNKKSLNEEQITRKVNESIKILTDKRNYKLRENNEGKAKKKPGVNETRASDKGSKIKENVYVVSGSETEEEEKSHGKQHKEYRKTLSNTKKQKRMENEEIIGKENEKLGNEEVRSSNKIETSESETEEEVNAHEKSNKFSEQKTCNKRSKIKENLFETSGSETEEDEKSHKKVIKCFKQKIDDTEDSETSDEDVENSRHEYRMEIERNKWACGKSNDKEEMKQDKIARKSRTCTDLKEVQKQDVIKPTNFDQFLAQEKEIRKALITTNNQKRLETEKEKGKGDETTGPNEIRKNNKKRKIKDLFERRESGTEEEERTETIRNSREEIRTNNKRCKIEKDSSETSGSGTEDEEIYKDNQKFSKRKEKNDKNERAKLKENVIDLTANSYESIEGTVEESHSQGDCKFISDIFEGIVITEDMLKLSERITLYIRQKLQGSSFSTADSTKTAKAPTDASHHMTQLNKELPVFVKSSKLVILRRYRNNPREMTRQLLLELIGPDELKKLTALGRSKRGGIPEDIYEAVFKYVDKKRENKEEKFTREEYNTVINNLCGTLRHPKKGNAEN